MAKKIIPRLLFLGTLQYEFAELFKGWHSHVRLNTMPPIDGGWGGTNRERIGTLVVGPSGSGKTVFMAHDLPQRLKVARDEKLVTVVMRLGETLADYDPEWDRGVPQCKNLRMARVRDMLPQAVLKAVLTVETEYRFEPKTRLLVCIDEIEIVPGVMGVETLWYTIAQTVRQGVGNVIAVHVAAGGTGAETPRVYLASNLESVVKVRLPKWEPALVKKMINTGDGCYGALTKTLDALCSTPHGLTSAMTNPRMAKMVIAKILSAPTLLRRAVPWNAATGTLDEVDTAYVHSWRGELLNVAVREYVNANGLRKLIGVDFDAETVREKETAAVRLKVARGVGLGALRVAMGQNAATPTARFPASSLDAVCADAAEHLGLIATNFNARGDVQSDQVAYEMHPGTVLVALHLIGLDVGELPMQWQGLEALTTLALTLRTASDFLLKRVGAGRLAEGLPDSLRHRELPMVDAPINRALQWCASTELRRADEGLDWLAALPENGLSPVVSKALAPLADIYAFRCLAQCKYNDPSAKQVTSDRWMLVREIAKGGLLEGPNDEALRQISELRGTCGPEQRKLLRRLADALQPAPREFELSFDQERLYNEVLGSLPLGPHEQLIGAGAAVRAYLRKEEALVDATPERAMRNELLKKLKATIRKNKSRPWASRLEELVSLLSNRQSRHTEQSSLLADLERCWADRTSLTQLKRAIVAGHDGDCSPPEVEEEGGAAALGAGVATSTQYQQRVVDVLLHHWENHEATLADASNLPRCAADFLPDLLTLGDRHLYPLNLLLQTGRAASCKTVWRRVSGARLLSGRRPRISDEGNVKVASQDFPSLNPRRSPRRENAPCAPRPELTVLHRHWCEFRFVVTDLARLGLGTRVGPVSHTIGVFVRDQQAQSWVRVRGVDDDMEPQVERQMDEVQKRLRTDTKLTLIAVTVSHVCGPESLSVDQLKFSGD